MAVGRPSAGERRFIANQHKVFALNSIMIVDFLFLKHFYMQKNEGKMACFCLYFWTLRTSISSFATEDIIKFLQNRVFLLLYEM